MEDAVIVAELVGGELLALEHAYEKYSSRLYTYARTLVPHAAEDIVVDTFLLATARISQLRDPDKLRPWLYAICRNECLRQLRQDGRLAELDSVAMNELPQQDAEPDAHDAAGWITAAYAGMNASDVEILTLSLRHELGPKELGEVTGVSANEAATRLSRARKGLEESLQALVLYRTATDDCVELAAICDGAAFDGVLRKRIARHARDCSTCGERRRKAAALILAGPAWAMEAVPASVHGAIFGAGAAARMAELTSARPPFIDGWPATGTRRSARSLAAILLAVFVVLICVTVATVALGVGPADSPAVPPAQSSTAPPSAPSTSTTNPSPALTSASPTRTVFPTAPTQTPTLRPSPKPTPTPTRTNRPRPTPRPTQSTPTANPIPGGPTNSRPTRRPDPRPSLSLVAPSSPIPQ